MRNINFFTASWIGLGYVKKKKKKKKNINAHQANATT